MILKIKHRILSYIIKKLAIYLEKPSNSCYHPVAVPNPEALRRTLQPCDILMVEGNLKYSEFIKYVTQSTWSHCALYIGSDHAYNDDTDNPPCLVEALLSKGVVISRLDEYFNLNTRILRPVSLSEQDKIRIVQFAINKIGNGYDIKNVLDLLKYYVPALRILTRGKGDAGNIFGSGDPEQVICSSLIAQAFQTVNYPILPEIDTIKRNVTLSNNHVNPVIEILRKRHFSLFSPRDFDTSPYFQVVKPTLQNNFDYRLIKWED